MSRPPTLGQGPNAGFDQQYFRTLKIPLLRGREFSAHDNADSVQVVIINEAMAHTLWPEYPGGLDPVGWHILIGRKNEPWEVVGIAADVHQTGKDEDPKPGVYFPYAQNPFQTAMLVIRTSGDPRKLTHAVRNQISAIDPDQPVSRISGMEEVIEASQGQQLMMRLLGVFAAAATFLAVIGLCAVVSYSVVQRTREIAIRRALGAQRNNILSLVMGQALWMSAAGAVLGLCVAFALTRVMKSLLFHVNAADPFTFAGVAALFVAVALGAGSIPAWRASRIDPLAALRNG